MPSHPSLELFAAAALGLLLVAPQHLALDGASARVLRPGGFGVAQLALVPLKDLVIAAAWAYALFRRDVAWRGTRLLVGRGTRIDPAERPGELERIASA